MTTIRDVARAAGVAVSTVSKVINHYPNVSEETCRRVNEAIKELGFVPNTIASSLSSKQPERIALLINTASQTQIVDEIAMQYLTGAITKAQELRLNVIPIFFSMLQGKSEQEIEVYLQSQSIGGIVIFGMSKDDDILQRIVAKGLFKVVLVDIPILNDNTSYVSIDHKLAQKDVARKTITENQGPSREILYISGKPNGYVSEPRLEGMKELAEELDLHLSVHCGNFSEKQAREITIQYGKDSDILVCASDVMAIGAMKALTDMDVFHPVCGFDGINLMGYAGKGMNTVKQSFVEIAETAVEECERLMGGATGQRITLPHELVRLGYLDIIH